MTRKYFLLILVLIFLSFSLYSCKEKKEFDNEMPVKMMKECLGEDNYEILEKLSAAFDTFLLDNNFSKSEDDMLNGYKGYLNYLLDRKRQAPSWHIRTDDMEDIIQEIERKHFAELLRDGTFAHCIFMIDYPHNYLMARYKEIMPQHTVSPETFAGEFVQNITEEEFQDPVIKQIVALEYFLGIGLSLLRPDSLYVGNETF